MKDVVKYIVHPYKNQVVRARCRHCKCFYSSYKNTSLDVNCHYSYLGSCWSEPDIKGERFMRRVCSANGYCCKFFIPRDTFKLYISSEQTSLF